MAIDSVSHKGANAADLKRVRRKAVQRRSQSDATDKLPPHSPEAEQGALGCCLIEPSCVDECSQRLKHRTDVFYDLRHQMIFEAFMALRRAGSAIDVVTLQQHLKDEGLLEQCGGIAYLSSLTDSVPSAANLSYYLEIVSEKYRLRKIVHACTDIVSRVYDYEGNVDELVDTAQRDMERVFEGDSDKGFSIYTLDELDEFDLENDPDNLVGNGYCGKGESILVIGASGRGKSSLLMLRVILWALGRDFYGQKPSRPLSFVVWQTENNKRNMAKAFQGARNFLKLNSFEHAAEYEMLRENVIFTNCSGIYGREFIQQAKPFLIAHPRDFGVIDPLISFPQGEINSAEGAGEFIRKGIAEISKATDVAWLINHHTPKPLRDPRANGHKRNLSDYQYAGAGSYDIPGACRAVETLEESSDGVFRLIISKRGAEAQARHPNGAISNVIWLKHATEGGIHWEQMDPPEETEEAREPKEKPLTKPQLIATSNLGTFLSKCPKEGEGLREIVRRLTSWLGTKDSPKKSLASCSAKTIRDAVGLMLDNEKLELSNGVYIKGNQA